MSAGSHVQSVTGGTQKRNGKSGVTAYRSLLSRHHQTKHQSKSLMQNADLCACWQMPRVSEASIKPCRLPLGAQPTAFTQAVGLAKVPHAWVANGSWNIASQIREIRKSMTQVTARLRPVASLQSRCRLASLILAVCSTLQDTSIESVCIAGIFPAMVLEPCTMDLSAA